MTGLPLQAALNLVADLMEGSAAGTRDGVAQLMRMHYSRNVLPELAFSVLPTTAQRCAAWRMSTCWVDTRRYVLV